MNIAIVEDMHVSLEILRAQLIEYRNSRQVDIEIFPFYNAEDFLADYKPNRYTVVFMDIFMPGMNGIEAANDLRAIDPNTILIFLTASGDHMPQAFRIHAFDYIQKPAEPGRVFTVMDDILKVLKIKELGPSLTFSSRRVEYSLSYQDIVSVCATANYLEITDRYGSVFKTRMTFSAASEQLSNDPRFLQILRGMLVNMDYVTNISDNTCYLEGGITLPINVKSSKKIEQTWLNYSFEKSRQA